MVAYTHLYFLLWLCSYKLNFIYPSSKISVSSWHPQRPWVTATMLRARKASFYLEAVLKNRSTFHLGETYLTRTAKIVLARLGNTKQAEPLVKCFAIKDLARTGKSTGNLVLSNDNQLMPSPKCKRKNMELWTPRVEELNI